MFYMKNHKCFSGAFTIVELLVVIAIIGILAALLLQVLSIAKVAAQKKQAVIEITDIVSAIQKYDSDYGRFPVSPAVQQLGGDFTYGGSVIASNIPPLPVAYAAYTTNNAEVIAILMDQTNYLNGNLTVNVNHQKKSAAHHLSGPQNVGLQSRGQ